ncbi:type I-MYXAN CRISPR-associated protein Cas6/Cmx6 [Rubrivivax albus]|uniref:Type I-MYXAN CRISPR-associated protein Cas6/Cmx6 n=1 Tax=Rubrivivax albus TaxID=2499835 RepID=A0A437JXQ9_9BURK|nr:type I-MYXAN CRISPR-associated protein Cas6/Cmx6 [Rubrivivax albus]RVT52388.1 type I-MYXAN CRISPR-associated protein Cas6/Cmx6 [Rubrivivax albus]
MLVDLAFPVQGPAVPADHRALLAAALAERLPWLGVLPGTGMHRLNLAHGGGGLLSGRTRLTLRVPDDRADVAAQQLSGVELALGGVTLRLGAPTLRPLLPHRTLYAHFVDAEGDDEPAFLARMDRELQALGVACSTVCGREQALPVPGGQLVGYSLLLDGLVPDTALRVLEAGLGAHRAMGCGLFVPHKSAAAVGA